MLGPLSLIRASFDPPDAQRVPLYSAQSLCTLIHDCVFSNPDFQFLQLGPRGHRAKLPKALFRERRLR